MCNGNDAFNNDTTHDNILNSFEYFLNIFEHFFIQNSSQIPEVMNAQIFISYFLTKLRK